MATATPQPPIPAHVGRIDPASGYHQKLVRPNTGLVLPNAWLKWYDISAPGIDLEVLGQEARAFLLDEVAHGRLKLANCLGFVELHVDDTIADLVVSTWHREHELWRSAYRKELAAGAPFAPESPAHAVHHPAHTVWELVPLGFERDAWVRYLRSRRTEADKLAYVRARFEGMC